MFTYNLSLTQKAEKEFEEAALWYEQRSEGLGKRFILTVKFRLQLIEKYFERYPKKYLNFRETSINIFPYTIVYTFYKKIKEIHVSAIYHNSRNPKLKFRKNNV